VRLWFDQRYMEEERAQKRRGVEERDTHAHKKKRDWKVSNRGEEERERERNVKGIEGSRATEKE